MKIRRLFLLGFLSAILQVLLFRALMTVLYGHEMVIVGLLTAWLLGIALGCFFWAVFAGQRGVIIFGLTGGCGNVVVGA